MIINAFVTGRLQKLITIFGGLQRLMFSSKTIFKYFWDNNKIFTPFSEKLVIFLDYISAVIRGLLVGLTHEVTDKTFSS